MTLTDDEFRAFLEGQGYVHIRKLDDGWVGIDTHMFDLWPLCTNLDQTGYGKRYDYARTDLKRTVNEIQKMNSVDDVPTGWTRRMPEPLFFTIAGYRDFPKTIGQCMYEREIITHAEMQYRFGRDSALPGATHFSPGTIEGAVQYLNENGAVFEIYQVPSGTLDFVTRAIELGLGGEAALVIDGVNLAHGRRNVP